MSRATPEPVSRYKNCLSLLGIPLEASEDNRQGLAALGFSPYEVVVIITNIERILDYEEAKQEREKPSQLQGPAQSGGA